VERQKRSISVRVNGVERNLDVDPRTSLLDALREQLGLTGTKKGCNQGGCGACTVLADGRRVLSCLSLAVQNDGGEVTTIEGVDSPLQTAFVKHDGFQCGYCTSGQICSAIAMLDEHARGMPSHVSTDVSAPAFALSRQEIQERMSGNLCRCGAYNGIVDAITEVATVGS
jgi:xanthine dehydrogenase YagT iron-sulfur-binding subunit